MLVFCTSQLWTLGGAGSGGRGVSLLGILKPAAQPSTTSPSPSPGSDAWPATGYMWYTCTSLS